MFTNINFESFAKKVYIPFKQQYVTKTISKFNFKTNPLLEFTNSSVVIGLNKYTELNFFKIYFVLDNNIIHPTALGYLGYALIYIKRLKERLSMMPDINYDESLNIYNFYNLFYLAIYIAVKMSMDRAYKPKDFRNAFFHKSVSTKLLLEFELRFLELIDYNLIVSQTEFEEILKELI
jgi:hypothetical protein